MKTKTPKILALDCETAPNSGYFWGLFKQNISINHLIDTSRTMCFSAKFLGTKGKPEFMSEYHDSADAMILRAWELLNEADAVLTFNGESFDLPVLNKEFLMRGLPPPMPYHSVDLYRASKRFRFTSHKMDHLLRELGLTVKVKHEGFQLWINCMDGDAKAWSKMKRYNIGDVTSLIELYDAMLPWIKNHPNVGMYQKDPVDRPTCTNCGSTNVVAKGVQVNKTQSYQRYRCVVCETPLRGRYTQSPKNTNVLTGM